MRFFHPALIVQCAAEPGPTLDEMTEFLLRGLRYPRPDPGFGGPRRRSRVALEVRPEGARRMPQRSAAPGDVEFGVEGPPRRRREVPGRHGLDPRHRPAAGAEPAITIAGLRGAGHHARAGQCKTPRGPPAVPLRPARPDSAPPRPANRSAARAGPTRSSACRCVPRPGQHLLDEIVRRGAEHPRDPHVSASPPAAPRRLPPSSFERAVEAERLGRIVLAVAARRGCRRRPGRSRRGSAAPRPAAQAAARAAGPSRLSAKARSGSASARSTAV